MRCVISSECAIERKLYPQITDRKTLGKKRRTKAKTTTPTQAPESASGLSTHSSQMFLILRLRQHSSHTEPACTCKTVRIAIPHSNERIRIHINMKQMGYGCQTAPMYEKYDAKRKCYTEIYLFRNSEIFNLIRSAFASCFPFHSK